MKASFTRAADGTRLYWDLRGEGPLVVLNDGLANDGTLAGPLVARLARRARVLTWHYRGHGRSEPAHDPFSVSMESTVDDLRRILDAAVGSKEKAAFVGFSMGCQVNLLAWQRLPERFTAMVDLLGTLGRPFDSFLAPRLGRAVHAVVRRAPAAAVGAFLHLGEPFAPVAWAGGRLLGIIEAGAGYREFSPFLRHLSRLDGATFQALALASQAHSAEEILPTVTVPTLVVEGGTDRFSLPGVGRRMHEGIPGSEYLYFPRAGHTGLIGHAGPIGDAVETFLAKHGALGQASADARSVQRELDERGDGRRRRDREEPGPHDAAGHAPADG